MTSVILPPVALLFPFVLSIFERRLDYSSLARAWVRKREREERKKENEIYNKRKKRDAKKKKNKKQNTNKY